MTPALRLLFRFLGLLSFAVAFAALIVDGTRSVAAGHVELLSAGDSLARFAPGAFEALRHATATKLPILWNPILVTILQLPSCVVLGVLGFVFYALGRPGPRRIGYTRR